MSYDGPERREPTSTGIGIYKLATATLAGVVVSLVAAWISVGNEIITRAETIEIVRTYSPYVEDRKVLNEKLLNIERQLAEIKVQLERIK